MGQARISRTLVMDVPASRAYATIADYRNGHPKMLPPEFTGLWVEEGGFGAGTKIGFSMRLLGRTHTLHADISEPDPGRVLYERVRETGAETVFAVIPRTDTSCAVTITTLMPTRGGVPGFFESLFLRWLLGGIYDKELALLAKVA